MMANGRRTMREKNKDLLTTKLKCFSIGFHKLSSLLINTINFINFVSSPVNEDANLSFKLAKPHPTLNNRRIILLKIILTTP